jgi:integrase
MRVLTEAETAQLLSKSQGTRLYIPVLLAATTGMRRGEILALSWADSDLKTGVVVVTKSLEQTREALTVKAPKTAKGRRSIPLPALAVAALRRHKTHQAQQRLQMGSTYHDRGLVCPAVDGHHWQPDLLSHQFQVFLKDAGLPQIRFHDLRHTHATQLLRQSVHPKIVAERLGHSSITITLDTYSHVVPGLQEEVARQLDKALRKAIREVKTS